MIMNNYRDFVSCMEELHIDKDEREVWDTYWEDSQSEFPGENDLFFLKFAFLEEIADLLDFNKEILDVFKKTVSIIRGNGCLARLFWHCHYLLFCVDDYELKKPKDWPLLNSVMGQLAGMFPAVICISGIPQLMEFYKGKSIPDTVIKDTLADIKKGLVNYHKKNGNWGLANLYWLRHHLSGKYYSLGRLQYVLYKLKGEIRVYRQKNGAVIVLSKPGIRYRGDGQVDGTNDIYDCSGNNWTSIFYEDENFIYGNPILPDGYAVSDTKKLDKNLWKMVMTEGDRILDIHIPAGKKLSHESCGKSMQLAADFFAKYFPEYNPVAFHSDTWLFDSQFQEILPSTSNIVKFQREFYLYPYLSGDDYALRRIFGAVPDDMKNAAKNTSLQQAVIDYYSTGGRIRALRGFILMQDLNWGSQLYQRSIRQLKGEN